MAQTLAVEHGLDLGVVIAFGVTLVAWTLLSGRFERRSVTAAIVFMATGMIVGNPPLSLVTLNAGSETLRSVAELTLALVLFTDAARVDLGHLRRGVGAPARLLFIGFPLTVVLAFGAAAVAFPDMNLWVCAVIAAAVAPTDAALGAPLMADERIPEPIRQTLNVESGLNDGLATPIVTFFLAGAVTALGGVHDESPRGALAALAVGVIVGVVAGAVSGLLVAAAQRRSMMVAGAPGLTVVAAALLSYAVSVALDGNGFVAAFTAGLAFGAAHRHASEVLGFATEVGELLASMVWFAFGASVLKVLGDSTWQVVVFAIAALTLARMLPVALSLVRSGVDSRTVLFVGWFGPRGLASVVFALIAFDELTDADARTLVVAAVGTTVMMSVIAHGLTARPLTGRYARSAGREAGQSR